MGGGRCGTSFALLLGQDTEQCMQCLVSRDMDCECRKRAQVGDEAAERKWWSDAATRLEPSMSLVRNLEVLGLFEEANGMRKQLSASQDWGYFTVEGCGGHHVVRLTTDFREKRNEAEWLRAKGEFAEAAKLDEEADDLEETRL